MMGKIQLVNVMCVVGLVVVMSAMLTDGSESCREKYDEWNPLSFSTLFRHHGIRGLIQGRVTHVFPPRHILHLGHEVITAQVEVECIFRGTPALERLHFINVTGFGESNDCVTTRVERDHTYFLFVEPFSHEDDIQYVIQELNLQRGAFEATNFKVASVTSRYECRRPQTPATTTLAPWRSLTPVKQLPIFILPNDFKSPVVDNKVKNGAKKTTGHCNFVFVVLVIATLVLL